MTKEEKIDIRVEGFIERAEKILPRHRLLSDNSRFNTSGALDYYGLIVSIAEMIQKEEGKK